MTETKCNVFGRVRLLNTESKQMQTCSIKWNYLATKQEFFLPKVASVQSITDIVLLVFLLVPLPAPLYFILHYHLFFRKEFSFLPNVYISVNMIFECCYKLTNLLLTVVLTTLLHLPKEKANFSKIGEGDYSVVNLGLFFQS